MSAAVMPIRSVPSAEAPLASASESTATTRKPRKPMKRVMTLSFVFERLLGAHVGGCGPAAWLHLIDGRRRDGGDRRREAFGNQVTACDVAGRHGVEWRQGVHARRFHVRTTHRRGEAP